VKVTGKRAVPVFTWTDTKRESAQLDFGQTPVLRYMYKTLDNSSTEKREETFKVYHHLFDPAGKQLVTNGAGAKLYPHHLGIFYGFKTVTYDGEKTVDIWHCPEAYQAHEKFLAAEGGPVLGRHRVQVAWHGKGDDVFAREEREMTVYHVPGGTLLQFVSRLRTTDGPVKLDGDPQHSGFHFRATMEVADKTKDETIFVRPNGVGKPGEERNWPKEKEQVNLPWDAMSFVLGGQRFTMAYLDRPDNPKEARYSERTYGRFGSYFVAEVTKEKPLTVSYRLWLQEGQMKGDEVAALDDAFVKPVKVTIK
jgi:Methane oxygenase PmoA